MRSSTIRRIIAMLAVTACAIFAATASAQDVTSKIINDVAADGKVDGTYTNAQLRAALASPLLAQYGGSGGKSGVESALGGPATGESSNLPFTGADALLFAIVGGGLVIAGVTLRRYGRGERDAA